MFVQPPGPDPGVEDSKCEVCTNPANYMCSSCKGAHYCSTDCQVSKT